MPLVLLAEDDESNRLPLSEYLTAKGYEVATATDGQEALERCRELQPDAIIMDIRMAGMDGLEAITRLRADPDLRHIPVIALTALVMPGDRERCLAAGADEYLSKPVSLRELGQLVARHVRRGQAT